MVRRGEPRGAGAEDAVLTEAGVATWCEMRPEVFALLGLDTRPSPSFFEAGHRCYHAVRNGVPGQ